MDDVGMDHCVVNDEADASAEHEVSGAVEWAQQCAGCPAAGVMRSWVDLPDGMIWTASLILLRHLERSKPQGWWQNRRILELGAGLGHCTVGLARLGAHVTATESAESHNGADSDSFTSMVASVQKLLQAQPSLPLGGTVSFRKLHWGLDDLPPNRWDGFEVVILSELYFDPDLHEPLLQTLQRILQPGMVAYSIFCDRPFSCGFLIMLDDDGSFDVNEVEPEDIPGCKMCEDEIVYMHMITRKMATTKT